LRIKEEETRLTLHEHDNDDDDDDDEDDEVYYLLLFFDMPPANQPTIMGEALSHKKFGPTLFI